jgi:hypothetical protein
LEENAVAAEISNKGALPFYILSGIAAAWGLGWIIGLLAITK